MKRYVYIGYVYTTNFPVVIQIVDTDAGIPTTQPDGASGFWIDATGNTTVQLGWKALESYNNNGTSSFTYAEPSYEDYQVLTPARVQKQLEEAVQWLKFNPLHYKQDLGIANSQEQATLLAYKQYFVALSDVRNQPGYPSTINWPVAPF